MLILLICGLLNPVHCVRDFFYAYNFSLLNDILSDMKKFNSSKILKVCIGLCFVLILAGCQKYPEMSLEEIEAARAAGASELVEKTVRKPKVSNYFVAGKVGGSWNDSVMGDPKSFNMLVAEKDGTTAGVMAPLVQYLADYDIIERRWKGKIADFEIKIDEEKNKLDIIYTIKDNVYWTFYNNIHPRVKVTSDDVVFWYNEIHGDVDCGSSAYNSQYMPMVQLKKLR